MKEITLDDICEMKGVDGGSGCNVWVALRYDDKPPTAAEFITGCSSIAKGKKLISCEEYLEGRKLGVFNWNNGKWLEIEEHEA